VKRRTLLAANAGVAYFAESRTLKPEPLWKPPASVKLFAAGLISSAYLPAATQITAPLSAASTAAVMVL